MVRTIVGIAGSIGSGKTSISYALSEFLPGADIRSFGDVVREVALAQGRTLNRTELQNTGEELIEAGWDGFIDLLLSDPPTADVLVVDGIRHIMAVDKLVERWPAARFILAYIKPSPATLAARLKVRGEDPAAADHPVEADLPEVLDRANLVLVDDNLAYNVSRIVAAVEAD